jgi:exodeoxyribonuclease VII large subunit
MSKQILSVSQLTHSISLALEENIGYVNVQGEISNFKAHSSGHRYFTLKDESAQVSCTMWKNRQLAFTPTDGMKVIIDGRLTVYPPRGQYQIECDSIRKVGIGDLYARFEELKLKLQSLGYFDQSIKKRIPSIPLHIGVATSPTGAAVRDIFSTIERRMPACTVYFRPTLVQGDGSAEDIVRAIRDLQDTPSEVIIIGRGGGSLEDLWAFNMEIVADAIFNATVPIVSAVGHETDFTIADFVADVRAATPTAAAELVTARSLVELFGNIDYSIARIKELIDDEIQNSRYNVDSILNSYSFRRIMDKVKINRQKTDELELQLGKSAMRRIVQLGARLDGFAARCKALYPLSPIDKGFALLKHDGKIIPSDKSLIEFDEISILRSIEEARVKVIGVGKN